MATIGQHISNLKNLLELNSRTPEVFEDQFLYELLKGARSEVISNLAKKYNFISEWNWNTYTIQMETATPAQLECVPSYLLDDDCKLIKSVCKIPKSLKGRNKSLFNVTTLSGDQVNIYSEDEWSIAKNDRIKSNMLAGSIINGYLYIWNNNKLKFIKISGIFEDPTEWADCPKCNPTTGVITTDPCFDIYSDDFALDDEYKIAAYRIIFDVLKIPLALQEDETNDSNNSSRL